MWCTQAHLRTRLLQYCGVHGRRGGVVHAAVAVNRSAQWCTQVALSCTSAFGAVACAGIASRAGQ
eukprot:6424824-Pyramimonas_sp.AAC.1